MSHDGVSFFLHHFAVYTFTTLTWHGDPPVPTFPTSHSRNFTYQSSSCMEYLFSDLTSAKNVGKDVFIYRREWRLCTRFLYPRRSCMPAPQGTNASMRAYLLSDTHSPFFCHVTARPRKFKEWFSKKLQL